MEGGRTPLILPQITVIRSVRTSVRGACMALLTIRAAAERVGVGYSTFKRWVLAGRVRTTRTEGGHHRVAEAELDRLAAKQNPDVKRRATLADPDDSLTGLSARNRLRGFVDEVRVDGLL